ncbi:MAG: CBS domain-containing protein [Thermotogae bacterium]|nr:CBS domain-containing protein [Thermotogota bacterium]
MKIVTPHRNPDFDAFASAVAVKKLHPEFEIVLSGNPQKNLREFLSIHSDYFPFKKESEIDPKDVDEMIIVDTSNEERLGKKLREALKHAERIVIYDHHPSIKDRNLKADEEFIEDIGSTTTILVREMMEKNVEVDPITATLLSIAIYEDTGNFLYSSTTPDDLRAQAWLLERGANLNLIYDFVSLDLTHEQREMLNELMENMKVYDCMGYEVYVACAERDKYIGGLNVIASKLKEITGYETLILIVRLGRKIFVIGRTSLDEMDIGSAFSELGGGGHRKAGSVRLDVKSVEEAVDLVLEKLRKHTTPVLRAKDLMSFPVKVTASDVPIYKVNRIMELTGYTGLPVVEGNKLIGMVTKRDVDKAMNHGLGKRPIKSIMSTKITTVGPETPVSEIRRLMLENDIGKIPVIENGVLVGIITKSDILRSMHIGGVRRVGARPLVREEMMKSYDVREIMKKRLPKRILNILRLLGNVGDELEMPVYVVGGFVRDLLLGVENYDIDVVVEGNGVEYAEKMKDYFDAVVVIHERFGTAIVHLKDHDLRIDVATARTEYYEAPAELPKVEMSNIKRDLYRRDFSINAMAIKLNNRDFGTLIDFFGCRKDLENGIIRVLYNLSFIEDPTRILRAVRFEQRYGFRIEERTEELLRQAVEEGYIEKVTGLRLREEFEKILDEKEPFKAVKRLAEFNVIVHLFPKTYYTQTMEEKVERLFKITDWMMDYSCGKFRKFYALMYIFLEYHEKEDMLKIKQRYGLPSKLIEELLKLRKIAPMFVDLFGEGMKYSDIYKITKGVSYEGFAYLSSYLDDEKREIFKDYLVKLKQVRLKKINGDILIKKYGFKPGPILRDIMDEIFSAKLDGIVRDEDEENYLREKILSRFQR